MMKHGFEVKALDVNGNILSLLRYSNLQWTRKYYSAGTFSVQIPLSQYNPDIKYIYTSERPELGVVSQVNYIDDGARKTISLSGYFLEYELSKRIVYPKANGYTNITNGPSWVLVTGPAEDTAYTYFNAFKDITYTINGRTYTSTLGINASTSQHRGKNTSRHRLNDVLMNKMYSILRPSNMSFRVVYDFDNNTKTFSVIKGRDLTSGNQEGNNPIIFSTRYGNLKNPNVVVSSTNYKNCYISVGTYTDNDIDITNVIAGNEATESDTSDRFLAVDAQAAREDYDTEEGYLNALRSEGHNALNSCKIISSYDFDVIEGSYNYMEDFDLGDLCSIEIPEVGVSVDAVLSGCIEVIKDNSWSLTVEFDT